MELIVILNVFVADSLFICIAGVLKQHVQVLELGSGTGIVGISAALLGGRVTLTDLPEAMVPLTSNIAKNVDSITDAGGTARALVWDWTLDGGPPTMAKTECPSDMGLKEDRGPTLESSFSESRTQSESHNIDCSVALILGADLVYSPRQVSDLCHAHVVSALCVETRDGISLRLVFMAISHVSLLSQPHPHMQVMPLVSALSKAAKAHPHADMLLAHKHRSDATDLQLLQALSKAGFQVQPVVVPEVHKCISCSGNGEGNADQYTLLLSKFPSVSIFKLHLNCS